jgi:hypothetical protein
MADDPADLFALAEQMAAAVAAVQQAEREARRDGRIERAISLQLVLRSGADALLALTELLEAENRPPRPRGGGPWGGRRLRLAA